MPAVIRWSVVWVLLCGSVQADERRTFVGGDAASAASDAVVVPDGTLVHTAQLFPVERDQRLVGDGDLARQTQFVLGRLEVALAAAGARLADAVKLNVYVRQTDGAAGVRQVLAAQFPGPQRPAVSFVVTPLPVADALVAMDAVAFVDAARPSTVTMRRSEMLADDACAHVGLLPRGARIYVAGQAEKGATLAEATRKTLESLQATLKFLGRTDADVVQVKAFLHPMSQAADVRAECQRFYGASPPPLVLVEWQAPQIEIELIAWGGPDPKGPAIEYLTPPGMTASPIFSRVARVNHPHSIYVSGLYAPSAGNAGARDAADEVQSVFDRLGGILKKSGSDFRHLAKATYYVSNGEASKQLNALRPRYYDPQRPPSASKAAVVGTGWPGTGLTIDMIAAPASDGDRP